ncbi:hypothetical protein ACSAMZ_18305 [Xanthomonas citri pv. bilvae]|uniref:hypothetical protein n=1 Tax=Xanthomonas citri TaxID=346 RepID=UPI0009E91756
MAQLNHLFRALPALRSAIIPGLALALSACTAGESAPHAVPTSAPPAPAKNNASAALQINARLAALIQATGVTCTDATTAKGCTAGTVDSGDFHDVEFSPDCGNEGFFAGVAQAIGRAGQDPRCYYVAAIPASTIARCKNNALCKTYGDRQIKQIKRASGESCHPAAPGQYVGNCAQGWVSADALDVFSNGI